MGCFVPIISMGWREGVGGGQIVGMNICYSFRGDKAQTDSHRGWVGWVLLTMKIITGDGGKDRGRCVYVCWGGGHWAVCLAFLHRMIRFRVILKRANGLGPVDKEALAGDRRREGGLLGTSAHYFSTDDTVQIDPEEGGSGGPRVGSHVCCRCNCHMQITYHFLVDGEGQVDEMGLGPIVLRAGGCRVGHIDGTTATYRWLTISS